MPRPFVLSSGSLPFCNGWKEGSRQQEKTGNASVAIKADDASLHWPSLPDQGLGWQLSTYY